MVDEIVGTTTFSIEDLPRNTWEKKTFVFNDVSIIILDVDMSLTLPIPTMMHFNNVLRYHKCTGSLFRFTRNGSFLISIPSLSQRNSLIVTTYTLNLGTLGPHLQNIMLTCPYTYNTATTTPFDIVKNEFTGVNIFFLFLLKTKIVVTRLSKN